MNSSPPSDESSFLRSGFHHVSNIMSPLYSNDKGFAIWGGVALLVTLLYFLRSASKNPEPSSRKVRQARAMRKAFQSFQADLSPSRPVVVNKDEASLQISQIWIYPIKSLRGCQVPSAMLTAEGFYLDRRFMLLKDLEETPRKLQNMHVPHFPAMALFTTSIQGDTLTVSYSAPGSSEVDRLDLPLEPEFKDLDRVEINMHNSPTTGYDMGKKYNDFFSKRFGFKVILAFWGSNTRPVLGNRPGISKRTAPTKPSAITNFVESLPIIGPFLTDRGDTIAFNDCAPYLVINEASVKEVTNRLPADAEVDITKFRANIVVKGPTTAFEEDFWGGLSFGNAGTKTNVILTGNCGRCASLNVDYATGEISKERGLEVLKLLQKDRRVDPGMKYNPIFGRYGFVGRGDEGEILRVGDEAAISRRNEERTVFYWPGLST